MLKYKFLLVLIASILMIPKVYSGDKQPNIILIFIDDQGYYDISCYGAEEVTTTRIDRLAEEGVRFTDYYAAAPICSPSRAGLMTGCYPRRVGNAIWVHRPDSEFGIHPDELTMAELFKQNGYATACIGKWHLGFDEPFLPNKQGFDHHFGLLHNLDYYEAIHFKDEGGVPLLRNGEVVMQPVDPSKLTRMCTDEAIDWIESTVEDGSKPFFMYMPHTMLHVPLGVSDEFKGKSNWGDLGDATLELDFHIGRLMDKLEELGIDDNTLVVYTSDNGRRPGRNEDQPLGGGKLSTWDGGLKVPCIAWGPGLGIQQGAVSNTLAYAMDWYPTLASIAGIKVPDPIILDGRDLSGIIKGESQEVSFVVKGSAINADIPLRRYQNPAYEWSESVTREEYLNAFFYFSSVGSLGAVRSGKWKLHLVPDSKLYDLEADPGEKHPVEGNNALKWKLRGMGVMFQEEMEISARPAGFSGLIGSGMKSSYSGYPSAVEAPSAMSAMTDLLEEHEGLVFSETKEQTLRLDLYRPKYSREKLPAIVCIHGGGWSKGTRQSMGKVAKPLAYNGYVTVTIDYRLSGVAAFPAQIEDCKAAVRWLRTHAEEYGIDASRIGATGHSAGGHLAALLATSAGCKELGDTGDKRIPSSRINAAAPWGAQTDLLSERSKDISADAYRGKIWRQFLGGTQEEKPDVYALASPLHHLDKTDPPIAILTGEEDDLSTRAENFRDEAAKLGVTTRYIMIEEAPHNFFPNNEWLDAAIYWSLAFFNDNL